MASNLIGITLIIISTIISSANSNKLVNCKFGNVVGRCIEARRCPQFVKTPKNTLPLCETENFVCCPLLERIVTPNAPAFPVTPIPTLPPPPGIATPAPAVTVPPTPPAVTTNSPPVVTIVPAAGTTASTPEVLTPAAPTPATSALPIIDQMSSSGRVALKCEEYKHRVIKRSSIVTYVFGGTESQGREFPHMAALGYGSPSNIEWLCGGSLISEEFVVTAAHCVAPTNNHIGNVVVIRLGELDFGSNVDDANPQDFGIAQQFVHPAYTYPLQYNDIALLKLNRPVTFDQYIAPICLQTSQNLPNANFIATGWGTTDLRGIQSDSLMKVDLEYFPNSVCRQVYTTISPESLPSGIIDDSQICAGSYTEEKDTCQGDSGGPLQIRDDALYLVGITSFGKACGVPNSPAVYTRVSYFVNWVQPIVWPSN